MADSRLVDLSARLREPGLEYKASIDSETRAAASAGITTLCVPADTDPVIDEPAVVELIHHKAKRARQCLVYTLGALTAGLKGEHLSEMATLQQAGCLGVTNGKQPVKSTLIMRRALEYASTHNITVFIEPHDADLSADAAPMKAPSPPAWDWSPFPMPRKPPALHRYWN